MPTLQHNDIFAGRYLLDECLASRHLAEVWKVKDLLAEGTLALKVFVPANKLDASTLAQLKADCTKVSQLSHPHLLQYRHFDVHEGIPYLLMPYLPHGSLSRRVQENGPLEEQEVAQLLKQVASALHYLHTRQPLLLHHAIRPENILITPKNTYVLTDHGLNYRTRSSLHKAADQAGVTDAAYAPPELFSAHPTRNEAGDIFSLGVTLYEVCTGELPWMGKGGISLLQGAAIPYLPGTYARVLSNILRACLDANPEKRPGALELEEEAAYFLEHGTWKPFGRFGIVKAETVVYKKRSVLKPALVATAVLVLLVAAIFFLPLEQFIPAKTKPALAEAESKAVTAVQERKLEKAGVIAEAASARPLENEQGKTEQPEPAPPKKELKRNATVQEKAPVSTPKSAAPSYPRPSTLEGYLTGMTNNEIPLTVRDRWKPGIRSYFADEATIHYSVDGTRIGQFTLDDFLEVLISTANSGSVLLDIAAEDEAGKVAELYVSVTSAEAVAPADSIE